MHPDIIVIGSGIIGLTCAWRLAERGLKVQVIEAGPSFGGGASAAALGALWYPSPLDRGKFTVIFRRSLATYPRFIEELENWTGIEASYTQCGAIELIRDDSQLLMARRECEEVGPGAQLRFLSASETRNLLPDFTSGTFGAVIDEHAARVSTSAILEGLYTACRKYNVEFVFNTPVRSLCFEGSKISGVRTAGEDIATRNVLVTAGAGSAEILPELRINPVRGGAVLFSVPVDLPHPIVRVPPYYFIKVSDGEIAVAGSVNEHAGEAALREIALRHLPLLRNATHSRYVSGLRSMSSDRKPIIGRWPRCVGLTVAVGHYKVGFALAPITAEIIVNDILEDSPFPQFLPNRLFSDTNPALPYFGRASLP